MTRRRFGRVLRLAVLPIVLFASNALCRAEDGLRLRAINPKPFYRPGDTILLEMRCGAGITEEAIVLYNPTRRGDDSFLLPTTPKCPVSRFEIPIPRDFIGENEVIVLTRHLDQRYADMFHFEARSEAQPSNLLLSIDPRLEGCSLFILGQRPVPQSIGLFAVASYGTRFDLCREAKAAVVMNPPDRAMFEMKDGVCSLTPKKPGQFQVIASYRGLRKEMTCTVDASDAEARAAAPLDTVTRTPRPTTLPATKISVDEFLADPTRLDHHPVEIGRCRTVEHWDTGYCYVFSEGRGKVSQAIDDRCDNLAGLRDRMLKAIRQGFCDSRASEPELAKPSSPHVRAPDPLIPKPSPIPPGAAGSPPRISIPAFRNDARRLDRHPMDVGQCRLVEHHRTGYCYVYSFPESQKVSETADARCTELEELRRRMRMAIDEGHCGIPAGTSAAASPSERGGQAELKKTMSDMRALGISVEAYAVDHNTYPVVPDFPGLAKLVEPMYIGKAPLIDGWGTPFKYVCDGKKYRIVSAGADRSFEPDSTKLDATPDGETDSLARDLVYSNGAFLQWPKEPR